MVKYDYERKTSFLICNICGKVFVPDSSTEDIRELRALSIKYGWIYRKYLARNGIKTKENLCPSCVEILDKRAL